MAVVTLTDNSSVSDHQKLEFNSNNPYSPYNPDAKDGLNIRLNVIMGDYGKFEIYFN